MREQIVIHLEDVGPNGFEPTGSTLTGDSCFLAPSRKLLSEMGTGVTILGTIPVKKLHFRERKSRKVDKRARRHLRE